MRTPTFAFILSPWQNAPDHEIAEVLVDELTAIGVDALITSPDAITSDADDVFVLVSPHDFLELEGHGWLEEPHLRERTIGISLDSPAHPLFAGRALALGGLGAIFDLDPAATDAHRGLGIEAIAMPLGYTPRWDHFDEDGHDPGSGSDPSVDVLFYGATTPRRQQILARCASVLSGHESRLVLSDDTIPTPPAASASADGAFLAGAEKWAALSQSRMLLNIHRSEDRNLEWLRVLEAMHCGAAVLTETSEFTSPFVDGVHFVSVPANELPGAIDRLLSSPDRLTELRAAAYDHLRGRPLSASLSPLIAAGARLRRGRRPVRLPPLTRTAPEPHPLARPKPVDSTSELSILRQSMRELRLDLHEVRRDLARLREAIRYGAEDSEPPETMLDVHNSILVDRSPSISVILAVHNHADYVIEALDSVANSELDETLEIIIVDDASTDPSVARVREWISAHDDIDCRLLRRRINGGPSAARNTALDAVRGRYTFVLDSDNAVFARSLHRLHAALEAASGAAFAYGFLEAFDPDGPAAMMDIWPWQPWRFVRGNYIDTMAMIRTDHLRAMGGYSTDRRLYGWEDFDLWCRTAEAGGFGVHIGTFIGRYRRSATSVVSVANVSHVAPFAALAERCPRTMRGEVSPPMR